MKRFWTVFAVIGLVGIAALGTYAFAAGARASRTFTDTDGNGVCDHATACHPGQGTCGDAADCAASLDCPAHMNPGGGCAYCYDDLLARAEQLKLTDSQVAALKRFAADSARKRIDMAGDRRKAQTQWTALLDKQDVDLAQVRDQIERTAKAWADLRYACVRNMIGVKRILTPEQWNQWRSATGNMSLLRMAPNQAPEPMKGQQVIRHHGCRMGMCGGTEPCR